VNLLMPMSRMPIGIIPLSMRIPKRSIIHSASLLSVTIGIPRSHSHPIGQPSLSNPSSQPSHPSYYLKFILVIHLLIYGLFFHHALHLHGLHHFRDSLYFHGLHRLRECLFFNRHRFPDALLVMSLLHHRNALLRDHLHLCFD